MDNSVLRIRIILVAAFILLFLAALTFSLIRHKPAIANTKVKSDIRAIMAAIKNYESVYGALPCENNTIARFGEKNADGYDQLMELLTCLDGPDKDEAATKNSKEISFLYTFGNYKADGWIDQWKTRFNIILNSGSDKNVKIGNRTVPGSVFVYSSGPNRIDENGEGDDLASWK